MTEFQSFPKMARLSREVVITEKIDGTNAQVFIANRIELPETFSGFVASEGDIFMWGGSRTKGVYPGKEDNFGFAGWCAEHAGELFKLGPGRHFGEWWGGKIQRGYNLAKEEKRFSLFNTIFWADGRDRERYPIDRPACCHVAPVLYQGLFDSKHVENCLSKLRVEGSMAAPGFMQPERVVIYHTAANVAFKKTLEHD